MSILTSLKMAATNLWTAVAQNAMRADIVTLGGDYATTAGSANAYTLTLDAQFVLAAGTAVKGKANFTNTGACTLNVTPSGGAATGAKSIVNNAGSSLNPGDIPSGAIFTVIYDGTNFQLQSNQRIPEWVDEGSLVWAASSTDQTLTLVNSGRNIYKVVISFSADGGSSFPLSLQMNGDTGSHYAYVYRSGTTLTSATAQSSIQLIVSQQESCGGELFIPGKIVESGSASLGVAATLTGSASKLQDGSWSPSGTGGVSLSSLTFKVGGVTVTGNVHVYSLNL